MSSPYREIKLNVKSVNSVLKTDYGYETELKCSNGKILIGMSYIKPDLLVGEELIFRGKTIDFNKFKEELIEFNHYDFKDSYKFLLSKIMNFPKKALETLYRDYNTEIIINMLDNHDTEFLTIKGIGKRTLEKVFESWKDNKEHIILYNLLTKFRFSHNTVDDIRRYYNNDINKISNIVLKHPYELVDIPGVSFSTLDKVLLQEDHNPWDNQRVIRGVAEAGKLYMERSGSTVVSVSELFYAAKQYLNFPTKNFYVHELDFAKLIHPKRTSDFTMFSEKIGLNTFYKKEKFIFETLMSNKEISSEPFLSDEDLNAWIEEKELEYGIKISDKQIDIVKLANRRFNIFSLGGFAGSGKTMISKLVMELYNKFGHSIHCCALSGVASSRIKIVSGFKSKTIHSLLGFGSKGFAYNEFNKLPFDLIVLDEAGIVSVEMFYYLLKAIDFDRTKLFIIGDPAQLPPVGAGDPYKDMIDLDIINKIVLDKVFRQANGSIINEVSQDIRQHKFSDEYVNINSNGFYTTWFDKFEDKENQEIIKVLKKKTKEIMLNDKFDSTNLLKFQVITPAKKGELGVKELNNIVQSVLNPSTKSLFINGTHFKEGDKVIHLKNEKMDLYDNFLEKKTPEDEIREDKIYNGQIGIVKKLDKSHRCIFVYYPFEDQTVCYDYMRLQNKLLDLAYVMTAHKAQGNEFKNVITIMGKENADFLDSNYIYSAFTRAKENLYVFSNLKSFREALSKSIYNKRDTIFRELVKKNLLIA